MPSVETIKQLLEAGGNVELAGGFTPTHVKEFIRIAIGKGSHVVVSGDYTAATLIEFAKLGGKHFTFRQLPKP